jgi:hypothetical protein
MYSPGPGVFSILDELLFTDLVSNRLSLLTELPKPFLVLIYKITVSYLLGKVPFDL